MPRLYATREAVKFGASLKGNDLNAMVARHTEGSSDSIERILRRNFIPETKTKLFRWPPFYRGRRYVLELDTDLIAVTTLKTKAQDSSPTTIASTDYFLEPEYSGPPYDRIEIDLSSSSSFEGGDTPQRSISVLGRWGFKEDTKTAGTVSSGLSSSSTATSMVCSNAALIDVGDTLLIETESILVTERTNAAVGSDLLNGALTKDQSEVSVTVDNAALYSDGEVILVDSEKLLIHSRNETTEILTVTRAYDGSVLAAHNDNTAIHAFRTLTIVRGANGTTAATHADATAVSKYAPPGDIVRLAVADAIANIHQERSGYGRTVGAGDGAQEFTGSGIAQLWKTAVERYQKVLYGAVV